MILRVWGRQFWDNRLYYTNTFWYSMIRYNRVSSNNGRNFLHGSESTWCPSRSATNSRKAAVDDNTAEKKTAYLSVELRDKTPTFYAGSTKRARRSSGHMRSALRKPDIILSAVCTDFWKSPYCTITLCPRVKSVTSVRVFMENVTITYMVRLFTFTPHSFKRWDDGSNNTTNWAKVSFFQ